MARRNDLDIFADILSVARNGARKTRIVYNANLNFKIVEKYLSRLREKGLLEERERSHFTTRKGIRFLEQYKLLVAPIDKGKVLGDMPQ